MDDPDRGRAGDRQVAPPLSAEDAAALLPQGIDAATRAALYDESGGNPFYLEELQHASGPHPTGGSRAPLPAGAAPPASVAAAIRDELAALPADVRRVLESAAVVGGAFEPDLAAAVAGAPERVALAAIDRLLEADQRSAAAVEVGLGERERLVDWYGAARVAAAARSAWTTGPGSDSRHG